VQGALDARNKESDRIKATVEMITNLGMDITEIEDGWRMEGPQCIQGGQVSSFADHRIAMSAAIAGLVAQNPVTIDSVACVQTSFPQFFEIVDDLAV
jgi:3-phosphoshikimate 1-carboxyvinyltransferase